MGFVVLPALPVDITPVYDCYFAAFKDNVITKALFPFASAEDMTNPESEFRKGHTQHSLKWMTEGTTTQYTLKCVDQETGKIVGMALWDIYLTPSDWKKGEIGWLQGEQKEHAEALVKPLWDARAKYWDEQKYVYCHVVSVHPDYQKKGIGKLLVDFGIQVAQQAQLPIYVESSKEGLRLYEKTGFRLLKDRPLHMADGKEELIPLMAWTPQGRDDLLPKGVEYA